jgi:cation diffusion facilitator family transporter
VLTSVGVLVGLLLVEITGEPAFDAIAALAVAISIVVAGVRIVTRSGRVLVDEAPPAAELDAVEAAIADARARAPEIVGYHKLRARGGEARRYIDLHLQFRSGTTLEQAHELAHSVREAIETALPRSEVLIHTEPEDSFRPPEQEARGPYRAG